MRSRSAGVATLALVLAAGCGSEGGSAASSAPATSASSAGFPVAVFADLGDDPVDEEMAAELQAALAQHDVTGGGGMSATVMTADGTWSGTTGTADGVRGLRVDDQFAIASITKSVVAAQVLLMVEAGELELDDPAVDHLPPDLGFDTNGATVRQLLSHRSGLPDDYDALEPSQQADPLRVWMPAEVLALVPTRRGAAGSFMYSGTNYLLLGLMVEHVSGRPLLDVLKDGAVAVDGVERLVLQTQERPTEPMAVPAGAATAALESGGGYLPTRGYASANPAAGGIASDSPSLARWWRALCAGEIVSPESLTEMSTMEPVAHLGSYGLGVSDPPRGDGPAVGHTGQLPGFMSWAACLPEDEAVVVVLTNHEVADGHLAYSYGLARPLLDALRAR